MLGLAPFIFNKSTSKERRPCSIAFNKLNVIIAKSLLIMAKFEGKREGESKYKHTVAGTQ